MALQALARNEGDVELTARELVNDEFMVPAATLIDWITETHVEQYERIYKAYGGERERRAVQQAHNLIVRTGELQATMIERVGEVTRPELVSQALRALTDARRKGVNDLLLLTGRSITGGSETATVEAMTRLVTGLQGLGLIKVSPTIAATLTDADVMEDDEPEQP